MSTILILFNLYNLVARGRVANSKKVGPPENYKTRKISDQFTLKSIKQQKLADAIV